MTTGQKPIRFAPQYKLIVVALLVALSIWFLGAVKHMLTPFVAAIITAYLFNPVVGWFQRRIGMSRIFWIGVLYIMAFLVISGLGTFFWPRVLQQSRDLAATAPSMVKQLQNFFDGREQIEFGGLIIDLAPIEDHLVGVVSDLSRRASENVPHMVVSALESLIFTMAYLIVTFYLLLQAGQLKAWATNLVPAHYREEIGNLGNQIDTVFSAYIRGQLILVVLMAVLLYIPLSILKVPNALVIAIVSGVLEIIPIIGPWSAAGIAVTVSLFQTDIPFGMSNVGLAAVIGLIYLVLRTVEENIILPQVMGPLVTLHPAVVIFSLLAGGALMGPFGLFISIPVAAVIRIVLTFLYQKILAQTDPPGSPPTLTQVPESEAMPPLATTRTHRASH